VCTIHFWNNFHQERSKPNNFKSLWEQENQRIQTG